MACIRMAPWELALVIERLFADDTSDTDRAGFERLFAKVIPAPGALDKLRERRLKAPEVSDLELAQMAFGLRDTTYTGD